MKEYMLMLKRMGIRKEEERKKIRNAEREKQDRGEKDRALKGKRQEVRLVQSCIHQNFKFTC